MSFLSDARSAMYTLIGNAWSGVATIWDVENANRFSWRELIDNWEKSQTTHDVQPPFAVLRCLEAVPDEWGVSNEAYKWPVLIYYVTGLRNTSTGAAKSQETLMAEIEDAQLAMTAALKAYTSGAFSVFNFSLDASDTSAANDYMLSKNLPFYVGAVRADLIVGRTV